MTATFKTSAFIFACAFLAPIIAFFEMSQPLSILAAIGTLVVVLFVRTIVLRDDRNSKRFEAESLEKLEKTYAGGDDLALRFWRKNSKHRVLLLWSLPILRAVSTKEGFLSKGDVPNLPQQMLPFVDHIDLKMAWTEAAPLYVQAIERFIDEHDEDAIVAKERRENEIRTHETGKFFTKIGCGILGFIWTASYFASIGRPSPMHIGFGMPASLMHVLDTSFQLLPSAEFYNHAALVMAIAGVVTFGITFGIGKAALSKNFLSFACAALISISAMVGGYSYAMQDTPWVDDLACSSLQAHFKNSDFMSIDEANFMKNIRCDLPPGFGYQRLSKGN